jgi:hypothetical protein
VANASGWLFVASGRVAVNLKKVLNLVHDFRTELPDLFIGQKLVQPQRTNLHDRRGAPQGIKYLLDLLVALARQLIDRDVALVPALALIRTDPRDLIKHAPAKPLKCLLAQRLVWRLERAMRIELTTYSLGS